MSEQFTCYPQRDETWFLLIQCVIPLEDLQDSSLPHAMLLFNLAEDRAQNLEIAQSKPSPEQILAFLQKTIKEPLSPKKPSPYRPAELHVEDKSLLRALTAPVEELGIKISYTPDEELVEFLKSELSNQLVRSSLPGLLSEESAVPDLVGDFFSAAACFYRAAPWAYLSLIQPLSVRLLPQGETCFVSLMGLRGDFPGLIYLTSWDALRSNIFRKDTGKDDSVPPGGYHSCTFSPAGALPFTDLDTLKEQLWEVAGPRAYPFPLSLTDEGVSRPDRDQLLWYQAALRAIPKFVVSLKRDQEGEYLPSREIIRVDTSTGETEVEIIFPAGELPMETLPISREKQVKSDDRFALFPDSRKKERGAELSADSPPVSPGDKARDLIRQAWQEPNRANRVTLAYEAISLSRQCADAYTILAEDAAETHGRALKYFHQAVRAAEQGLDHDPGNDLDQVSRRFINQIEPYLYAKDGLASTLLSIGKQTKGVGHYQDMLRLMPKDPMSIRFHLLALLLDLSRYQEADDLLAAYQDDPSPAWLYTRALRQFQRQRNTKNARGALEKAWKINPYVPDYITIQGGPEYHYPAGFSPDEEEADRYARAFRYLWQRTPGAVKWLRNNSPAYTE